MAVNSQSECDTATAQTPSIQFLYVYTIEKKNEYWSDAHAPTGP
mgnify:CR=1 FL=1